MAEKNLDRHRRWRDRTVAFRMSDAEKEELDRLVALSGLTKQEYITSRLLERDVVVVPSSRVQKGMEDVSALLLMELRRLDDAGGMTIEQQEVLQQFAMLVQELGAEERTVDAVVQEKKMAEMERK